jgi:hypothetical protein
MTPKACPITLPAMGSGSKYLIPDSSIELSFQPIIPCLTRCENALVVYERRAKMLSTTKTPRVLGRMGARILTPEEMKLVSGGSTFVFNTPIMTFFGTNDPDVRTDFLHD